MTEPTDAEIVALADATRTAEGGANGYILPISFCRAVLAKWGQPTQAQAGAVPLTPWMKPGQFFGGRPERAMEIDTTDFYGITEAIHHALEMLENHSAAGTDSSPLDPKRSRRLRQALMAAWLLEYPDEAVHHGIKGGQHGADI